MNTRSSRRFTIADGMVLVAAVAVGSLLARAYLPGLSRLMRIFNSPRMGGVSSVGRVRLWLYGPGSCMVVPLMAATLALRLRRPRPKWLRIARQPGFAACAAAMASLVPGIAVRVSMRNRPGFWRPDSFDQVWNGVIYWTGPAVVGGWLALALCRRWKAEPDWVDRFGRLLGFYWVALYAWGVGQRWIEKLLSFLS